MKDQSKQPPKPQAPGMAPMTASADPNMLKGGDLTNTPTGAPPPNTSTDTSWSNFLGGAPGGSAQQLTPEDRARMGAGSENLWDPNNQNVSPPAPNMYPGAPPGTQPPGALVSPRNTAPSTLPPGSLVDPHNTAPSTLPPGSLVNPRNTTDTANPGAPPPLVGGDALRDAQRQAQDAAYSSAQGYLDPQFRNQEDALTAKLANQGIPQGSEAWQKAMDEFARNKTFAYSQAEQGAVRQGNDAQSQLFNQGLLANSNQFGQNLQNRQFSEQQRAQLVSEGFTAQQIDNLEQQHRFDNSMTMRNQDINELLLGQRNPLDMLNALNGGNQTQSPQFTSTPGANVGNTDIASIINQFASGQRSNYNTQAGSSNADMGAIASIVAAFI